MKKSNSIGILITLPFNAALIKPLQDVSPKLRITVHPAQKVEDVPADLWAHTEVLYTESLLPVPDLVPNLKWVQLHWAGIEKLLNAPILARPGMQVTTLSGAAATQSAEHVLTMLLALARQLPSLAAHQRRAEWPKDRWQKFMPLELRNSTVGIIGYGSIGRQVARLLREFGTTVLASKHDAMQPADSGYIPEGLGDPGGDLVRRLYPAQALKSMVRGCDFVVVAVPATQTTRNLVNGEVLAAMKPGSFLIDISRGGIVDHSALIKFLNEHKLAGAALDVFPEEPLPAKSPLWAMPNVIISPHIAGISSHYDERAMTLFAENITRYMQDLPLFNLYDLNKGY